MKFCSERYLTMFLILNIFSIIARVEYATALIDLEPLLNTQLEVTKTLENYIKLEEKRLEKVRRFSEEYDKLYKSVINNADSFLLNPVNVYLLVKRLTTDWDFVLHLVEGYTNKATVYNVKKRETFPNNDDLEEAADAIIRLQDIYLLNTTKLAKGEVAGMKRNTDLTASDCFKLGLSAYSERNVKLSAFWFRETLKRMDKDKFKMVNKAVLLDYLSYAEFWLGNVQRAMELTLELIEEDPLHPRAQQNFKLYQYKLHDRAKKNNLSNTRHEAKCRKTTCSTENIDPILSEAERYKSLCRGEHLQNPAHKSKLSCRYTTSSSKYLLLQPAKEETLNLDPWIVVYHDVIRDRDIDLLKEIGEPLLQKAGVTNTMTGSSEVTKYRVSENGWLSDEDHPRVKHISRLIEEITGLETDTAELLQINKYGLGGHYKQHLDFSLPGDLNSIADHGLGNRIATWLFYLNDVEAGGSTVFPELGVQVKPIKGSAGFWFNLFKSGIGDLRTAHAACPVLAGTKWVANKWFHEREQEFRRPCSLNPSE